MAYETQARYDTAEDWITLKVSHERPTGLADLARRRDPRGRSALAVRVVPVRVG